MLNTKQVVTAPSYKIQRDELGKKRIKHTGLSKHDVRAMATRSHTIYTASTVKQVLWLQLEDYNKI